MRRRSFLCVPAAVAVALEGCEVPELNGLTPWHMWGQSEIVTVTTAGLSGAQVQQQITKINYHRPETWSFFLAAEILEGPISGGAVSGVNVDFQLAFGLGLNMWDSFSHPGTAPGTVEGFAEFRWLIPAGVRPGNTVNNKKFATRILGPVLDDVAADPQASRQVIEWIPAQNINVYANVFASSVVGGSWRVKLYSMFAPRSHIRPDWFKDADDSERFQGGELGGT